MSTERLPTPREDRRNIKLVLAYDGSDFAGWQRQRNALSVQQALEEAIEQVTGTHAAVHGSGRTDAGVHARGQVANFHTRSLLPVEELQRALNALLPPTVAVLEAEEVGPHFHACFSAVAKHYRYTMWNAPVRPVFERFYTLHIPYKLNLSRMREAARQLVGEHDFAAFATHARSKGNTVRRIHQLTIRRNGVLILVDVKGSGFLYNMVRAIVGTLLEVGRGKLAPADVVEILAARDRRRAGRNVAARGLCLVSVEYPEDASC